MLFQLQNYMLHCISSQSKVVHYVLLEVQCVETVARRRCYILWSVQYLTKPLQTKIVPLVVDQATSVAVEMHDDTKKTFEEASGPAIYSNSEMTVSLCMSIFETLWIQSELDIQNKIKQAYFQMFKGLKLKDETYIRRWSFEQEGKQGYRFATIRIFKQLLRTKVSPGIVLPRSCYRNRRCVRRLDNSTDSQTGGLN